MAGAGAAAPAAPTVVLALGTPVSAGDAAAAGGVAAADAAGRVLGENIDGCPVCLFQASHSRTRDIVKTTQSKVRRISVMDVQ